MFSNTGIISFWFYLLFIVIAIVAMIVGYQYIKKSSETDKLTKMIDLFKYCVVSIGIATVTLIVSDLFKEREQDVKELEYFGKYADDMKKADGIAIRYELAKYLSIVAPSGSLKEAWKNYYDTILIEYHVYLQQSKELAKLDTIKKPTPEQEERRATLIDSIKYKEQPLIAFNKTSLKDYTLAKSWEAEGFSNLLAKKNLEAINAFTQAENAANSYHQVYEISRYLRNNQELLRDAESKFWKIAYGTLAKSYSGGMPDSVRKAMLTMAAR